MKKIYFLLLLFIGILIIFTWIFTHKDEIFIFRNNKEPFFAKEPILENLMFTSKKEELLKKFGNPVNTKREYWETYEDYIEYLYYPWGTVWFAPSPKNNDLARYIFCVEITKRGLKGPRGIQVGDSYKKVLNSFRYNPEKIRDKEYLYYFSKIENGILYEKFGIINYKDKEIDSIFYQDSLYCNVEFKIEKGKVIKIKAYLHEF
uniref:Uncharacterized protein n=1 Tax=Dictyoglomus thermophilum TaxID=14 RepID=A0A7C3MHI1_DICTH